MSELFGSESDSSGNSPPRQPASPAESDAGSKSPVSNRSSRSRSVASNASRSGSNSSKRSGSPAASNRSRSNSPVRSDRSRSGSPSEAKSPIRSASRKSGSSSPRSAKSGSDAEGGTQGSPAQSPRSRSGSPQSARSKSGSPQSARSRSGSPQPARSRSGSPQSGRSRSGSPQSARSRSGSPQSARSGSGSPQSGRSRSGSPLKTGSPARSGSGSPVAGGSKSRSPSPSGSPNKASDSGSDSDIGRKKRKRIKSDGSGGSSDDEAGGNLFGDAGDISSASDGEGKKSGEGGSDAEGAREEQQETQIEVQVPRINPDLGRALHFVKLPNFLSVETRPFDTAYYEDEIDEDEVLDEEGRARLKLKVENTMRWRYLKDADGNPLEDEFGLPLRQSNARIVRWSDNSMSLHLGGEIFDIHQMSLHGDYNHLFIRQGTGLQGQAVFSTKLTFRPHSTDSATHRKVTMSMANISNKTHKVRVIPVTGADPDANRDQLLKKEEEKLRASLRLESQSRKVKERAYSGRVTSSYLENDDIGAIKRRYKQKTAAASADVGDSDSDSLLLSSSEESEDEKKASSAAEESDASGTTPKKKARLALDSESDSN